MSNYMLDDAEIWRIRDHVKTIDDSSTEGYLLKNAIEALIDENEELHSQVCELEIDMKENERKAKELFDDRVKQIEILVNLIKSADDLQKLKDKIEYCFV